MKRTTIKSLLLGMIAIFMFSACEDWLDVSPKSQIEEEEQFSREIGYKDQLTGVYTAMCSNAMYGLQMGVGFTEVLSQNYNVDGNSELWRYAAAYDYQNSNCENVINAIWSNTYNCIANLNIMLKNIEQANPNMFEENHYQLYKGEALGLRAFLHFDLMRLFACAPSMDNNAKGVPYITEYSTNVVTQKTVGETMQMVINDLLAAKECLSSDSLKTGYSPYYQRSQRICYFNYYACVATLARAYLWMGDTQNAQIYAKEIVDVIEGETRSTPFSWTNETNLNQPQKTARDRSFSTEHIFHLKVEKWEDVSNDYLTTNARTNLLAPSDDKAKEIFETSLGYGNDYRYAAGIGFEQDGERNLPCKFQYLEGGSYNNIYPLIRMTEAVYILAECLKESNPKRAIELLNEVRENRHLSLYPLSETLTAAEIQNEIYKEYRKEFLQEGGQLFFYYKRLNASEIKGASIRPSKSVYVLPIPSQDVDFGGYEN